MKITDLINNTSNANEGNKQFNKPYGWNIVPGVYRVMVDKIECSKKEWQGKLSLSVQIDVTHLDNKDFKTLKGINIRRYNITLESNHKFKYSVAKEIGRIIDICKYSGFDVNNIDIEGSNDVEMFMDFVSKVNRLLISQPHLKKPIYIALDKREYTNNLGNIKYMFYLTDNDKPISDNMLDIIEHNSNLPF